MCTMHKNFTVFFLKPLSCFPQNVKRQGLGLEGLRTSFLNAAYSHGKKVLGLCDSLFSAFPLLSSWPVSSGGSLPQKFTARKTLPSRLHGAHSFLPFRFQLKCHFLRSSLDLHLWSPHWSSRAVFLFHNTYCNLQWSRIPLCWAVNSRGPCLVHHCQERCLPQTWYPRNIFE